MAFKVIFRKNRAHNHFREWLIKALNYPNADMAVICSGFFQENFKGSKFALTSDRRFMQATQNKCIVTVGIHNNMWLPAYRDFRRNFLKNNPGLYALISKRLKWHAKVFLLFSNGRPCFAIIGSSNMTSSAFGSPSFVKNYNYEADVVIWNSSIHEVNSYFAETYRDNEDYDRDEISLSYNEKDNFGKTELDRLNEIQDMLIDAVGDFNFLE